MQDFLQSAVVILRLNAGGHGEDLLGAGVRTGGIVAKGELLPNIHKQFGIAGAAENQIGQYHGGHVVAAAAETHGELALRDIHLLGDKAGRFRSGKNLHLGQFLHRATGQGGKGPSHRILHTPGIGAAAVQKLQPGGRHHLLGVAVEGVIGDLSDGLLVPQAADAVRLVGAHLLQKPEVGPVPLIIADGTDAVHQIDLLTVHILLEIAAAPGDRV